MVATVAIVGLLIMFALATSSQRSAWDRIAAARKEVFEDRRAIDELTVAMQVREDAQAPGADSVPPRGGGHRPVGVGVGVA